MSNSISVEQKYKIKIKKKKLKLFFMNASEHKIEEIVFVL